MVTVPSLRTHLTYLVAFLATSLAAADDLPLITGVEHQPLVSATERIVEALEQVGAPLGAEDAAKLKAALQDTNADASTKTIQQVLDPLCVAFVHINPESRVKVAEGPAKKELVQQGWRTFLVKVHNEAGVTAKLEAESPHAAPLYKRSSGLPDPKIEITPADAAHRWLDIAMHDRQPLKETLSGLPLEYRLIQLYSRDAGKREAQLGFHVGQGTQDIGFRNAVAVQFDCAAAVEVTLGVKDFDGAPTTAAFVIRDAAGRVYPNPARRLAPDFFFHNQIYRADGESVHLPPGEYQVTVSRGPEYREETHPLTIDGGTLEQQADFELHRWIHPAKRGWYSGDHHVHAAGCAHYENPTEGVTPGDMMRHIVGEDLNVGCVLSWGPCWYAQKKFFEGKTSDLSRPDYLMRYDVEVSGFPSSHAGHLCLLRLTEDDYPDTERIEQWPSWTLPVLKWGAEQGGVVGYSHSGWGLALPDYAPDGKRVRAPNQWGGQAAGQNTRAADTLPDYEMPPFDGIGANEYIVTAAHDLCHFISTVDTPAIWELNIWYHTLNCGLRSRISGETDFPCIYGDKVGLGRVYVKLPPDEELTFDNWIHGVKDGRSYCGDGLSHVLDFKVNDVAVGEPGSDDAVSQLNLAEPGKVQVTFDVAALLAEQPTPQTERVRKARLDQKPYWHIERCRVGDTRTVPVEVVVNGRVAARKEITADGTVQPQSFDVEIPHSSWVAVRILPSVHTNPVFVEVGGRPIRASRRSAEWCRDAVEVCWKAKMRAIRGTERPQARAAYDKARRVYERAMAESVAD